MPAFPASMPGNGKHTDSRLPELIKAVNDDRQSSLTALSEPTYYARQTTSGAPLEFLGILVAVIMAVGSSFAAMNTMYAAGRFVLRVSRSVDWSKAPAVGGLRVTLADNGCGIPAQNIARIFEPFFTTKGENGTGLGLWVARGIADRSGGSIRMRSRVHPDNSGTCFSVFLPNRPPSVVS